MKNLRSVAKRYRFFLLLAAINLVLLIAVPKTGFAALTLTKDNFLEMLSVLPPIFILLGLLDVWVDRQTMLAGGFVSIYFTYTSTNSVVNQSLQVMAQMAAENVSKNLERYKSIAQEVGSIARLSNADILAGEKEDLINQRIKTYGFQAGGIIDANGVGMFDHKTYSTEDYYKSAMQMQV